MTPGFEPTRRPSGLLYIPVLLHQVCTYHQVLRCWVTIMHAQLRSVRPAIYSPAAQRSVVRSRAEPCGAVPCPSLRCCVVLRCVLSFEHRAVPGIIHVVVVYYFSSFFFFYMYLIFHGPLFFPPSKLPPYCRSERNTGNNSTPHS